MKGKEATQVTELIADGELETSAASIRLVRLSHEGPKEKLFARKDEYWIDLCLTPRRPSATARFVQEWGTHRFAGMGPIIALPPRHLLHLKSQGGRHTSLICALNADVVDRWLPAEFGWTDRRLEACLDIANPTIRSILTRLSQEMRHRGLGASELCDALTFELGIEVARHLNGISEPIEKGGLADWRLRAIDSLLVEPGEPPTLGELAKHCRMSVRQLTRAFRMSRGCSIGDYMAQMRIEVAKRRLGADESIKSIALDMGFSSQSNFTYAFRKATGLTPSEFRDRLRGADRQVGSKRSPESWASMP
jgi:AraC family transcriptional regulator